MTSIASDKAIAHQLLNVIKQVRTTKIEIGHTEGHFVSEKQLAVIENCAESLDADCSSTLDTPFSSEYAESFIEEEIDTPVKLESSTRARRLEVSAQIKKKRKELALTPPSRKGLINSDIGQLLSERARLDKAIKDFEDINFE